MPSVYTVAEAARALDVSQHVVRQMIRRGELTLLLPQGHRPFRIAGWSVEQYLARLRPPQA